VTTQAVIIGAAPPTILPTKFIQPDTVPVYLPAMSLHVVQEEFMVNPRNPSANVNQIRVAHFDIASAVRHNPKQQNSIPRPANQARALDPAIFFPIK
jgi:hypothetical protein